MDFLMCASTGSCAKTCLQWTFVELQLLMVPGWLQFQECAVLCIDAKIYCLKVATIFKQMDPLGQIWPLNLCFNFYIYFGPR